MMDEAFALKAWPYGPLLVAAVAMFGLAGVLFCGLFRGRLPRMTAELLLAGGCAIMGGLWVYRLVDLPHLPMQSMFEIFLLMGAATYPLFAFCRAVFGARLPWSVCLIAIVLAFPAAFVNRSGFAAGPRNLPPALSHWLFGPHVAVYLLGYVIVMVAAFHAVAAIVLSASGAVIGLGNSSRAVPGTGRAAGPTEFERIAFNLARLAFPLLTLGLVLGSVWGQLAWGGWWNWDPKEMWSLAAWLTFIGYFHFRWMHPNRLAAANAAWVVAGAVMIVLTLLSSILPKLAASGMHSYAS